MTMLILLDVAAKAARMTQQDPHGWIMTLVAVSVVFLTLFLLQYCYRFIGWASTREDVPKGVHSQKVARGKEAAGKAGPETEVAAAIATALSLESSGEIPAAIGLALDRYFSESVHDNESYIITIKRKY